MNIPIYCNTPIYNPSSTLSISITFTLHTAEGFKCAYGSSSIVNWLVMRLLSKQWHTVYNMYPMKGLIFHQGCLFSLLRRENASLCLTPADLQSAADVDQPEWKHSRVSLLFYGGSCSGADQRSSFRRKAPPCEEVREVLDFLYVEIQGFL